MDFHIIKTKLVLVSVTILISVAIFISLLTNRTRRSTLSFPPTPSPLTANEVPDVTPFEFERLYKNGFLKFRMNIPKEWILQEGTDSLTWYEQGRKEVILRVDWINPDQPSTSHFCWVENQCIIIDEIHPEKNKSPQSYPGSENWLTIYKAGLNASTIYHLSNRFLYAEFPMNSRWKSFIIWPFFASDALSVTELKQIIASYTWVDVPFRVFLPTTDNSMTADWQRHLLFRYPKDWTLSGENYFLSVEKENKGTALQIYFRDPVDDLEQELKQIYPNTLLQPLTINNLTGFIVLQPSQAEDYRVYLKTRSSLVELIVHKHMPDDVKETIAYIIGSFRE